MARVPDNVHGHWGPRFFEGLQESPAEFYARVEAAVAKVKIPSVTFERVEYREGGALSGFREYLRVRRLREAFDVCCAPFATGTFFSWWLADVRPKLPTIVSIFIVFGYLAIVGFFASEFGIVRGPIVLVLLIPLALWGVSRMGNAATDDFIMQLPLIGPLYERLFQPITYYRIDTDKIFEQAVQEAVMNVVD